MRKIRIKHFVISFSFLFFSCSSVSINNPTESGTIGSIDIRAPAYFYMLRPWKKGTLLTMDGKARFAELSFVGKSRIKIKALVNFPMERIDGFLGSAPEAGVCVTQSGAQKHVADISSGKTKSFAPFINWRYSEGMPYIFDSINGIIRFRYSRGGRRYVDDGYLPYYTIIYDVKNDKILYESPTNGESVNLGYRLTQETVWGYKRDNTGKGGEYFFYNWRTREITRNEFTEKFNGLGFRAFLDHDKNINLEERFLFADIGMLGEQKKIKVTWDENYENVKVNPLEYLVPEGKRFSDISLSYDVKWATTFVSGYEGLRGELLVKRAFFHLDGRYPNGISMPVFVNDYDEFRYDWGSFVLHPEYGWCFAEEKYLNDKLHLRLYKMSDVLEELNRQLLEKANELIK